MSWESNTAPRDEATDAARFLCRLGYAVLAVAGPLGVVLHPLAIFISFPIGVALLAFAAAIDPPGAVFARLRTVFSTPPIYLGLAWLGWSALSLAWTPFPAPGVQRLIEQGVWTIGITLSLVSTQRHARATDLYLFPVGQLLLMAALTFGWIALRHGATIGFERIDEGGLALVVLLFPTMACLTARARMAYARLIMTLSFLFVYAIGSSAAMIALLVGLATLSFAISDVRRTARDIGRVAAGFIALAPLAVLAGAPLARVLTGAELTDLPAPFPSLAYTFHVVEFDWLRLITGHGIATVDNGVHLGALPAETPMNGLFEIWYEFGIVGALLTAAGVWSVFRAIADLPERLAPYLAAAFATNVMLGITRVGFDDMTWVTLLAIALVASDIAARSQYRTTRPSAEGLARL